MTRLFRFEIAFRLAVVAAFPASVVFAQMVTAEPENVRDTAALEISPFEVSTTRDHGYTATSSLAGSRLDTELKYTPSAIQVFTAEFLSDINADSLQAAAEFALNALPATPSEADNGNEVQFRSIGAAFTTRNFFKWYVPSDSYNVDRIEFALGPNAILFGDANIGGVINTVTHRARFRSATELASNLDSEGGWRGTFSVARPVNDKLAIVVDGLLTERRSWQQDYIRNRRQGAYLAGTYRVSPRTEMRFDAEIGEIKRAFPNFVFFDRSSRWDGSTVVTAPLAANLAASTGVGRRANDYLVFNSHDVAGGVTNLRNFGFTQGTGKSYLPNNDQRIHLANPGFPASFEQHFTLQPANELLHQRYRAADLFLSHRFSDRFFVELAGSLQMYDRNYQTEYWRDIMVDINRVIPRPGAQAVSPASLTPTIPNPNFGRLYADTNPDRNRQHFIAPQARFSAAYKLDLSWTKQKFSLMLEHREDDQTVDTYILGWANNPANSNVIATANRIWQRVYVEDGGGFRRGAYPQDPNFRMEWVRNTASRSKQKLQDGLVAMNGSYFGDRLHTNLGLRRDHFIRAQQSTDPVNRRTNGGAIRVPVDTRDIYLTSPSYGAVYFPVSWLGLYGNYSKSFNPNAGDQTLTPYGRLLDPTVSDGIDVGLKIEFWGGKISGTVGYYEDKQINNTNKLETNDINNIWSALGRGEMQLPGAQYMDCRTRMTEGWEVALTANPTSAWRVLLNVALPETRQFDAYPMTRSYRALHIDTWRAGAAAATAAGSTADAAVIANAIANIDAVILDANEGRALNLTLPTANIFTAYRFSEGRWKGVKFGAGANHRGKKLISDSVTNAFDYYYSEPFTLVRAMAGYDWKWRQTRWNAQLNVTNLLDVDKYILRSFSIGTGLTRRTPQLFETLDPRMANLTVKVRF